MDTQTTQLQAAIAQLRTAKELDDFKAYEKTYYKVLKQYGKELLNQATAAISSEDEAEPAPAPVKNPVISAAIKKFAEKHEQIQKSFPINFEQIPETIEFMKSRIPAGNLEEANQALSSMHKRKLDYEDIAIIWLAHCHNVNSHKDNTSPIKGIVGLAKVAKRILSDVHVSIVLEMLISVNMTTRLTEGKKGLKASTYEISIPDYREIRDTK